MLMAGAGAVLAPLQARADLVGALLNGINAGMAVTLSGVTGKREAQHRRLADANMDAGSAYAELYFRSHGLSMDSDGFSVAARKNSLSRFHLAMESLRRAGLPRYPTFMQLAMAGKTLASALVKLDEAWFHDELLPTGWVYVPAGGVAKADFAGYCLDQALHAPSNGEGLRLLPISYVTDEKTVKAMQRLAEIAAPYSRQIGLFGRSRESTEMQSLVWALRDMQLGITPKLNASQRRLLASVDPVVFGSENALDAIAFQLGEVIGKDIRRSLGGLVDLSNMGAVRGRMDEIISGANSPPFRPGPAYTLIEHGVSAAAINSAPLQADLVIANSRPEPVLVNMRSYVAEAKSNTQRILISDVANTIGQTGIDRDIEEAVYRDLTHLSAFAALEWFPDRLKRIGFTPRSSILGKMIGNTPVLGNLLSAAEFASGYEWTEWFKTEGAREPMSPAERVLAAAGMVPGVGAIARSVGRGAITALIDRAANLAGRPETAKNLAEWATSDTVWAIIAKSIGANPGEPERALRASVEQIASDVGRAVMEVERTGMA